MNWELSPGASLADLATIELRRITDVLQVDHASLFLRDADDPERTIAVAETGLPVERGAARALPCSSRRCCRRLRAAQVERFEGPGGACCGALASPLVHDDHAVGALLVVTRRASRRLGAIDSEVVQRGDPDAGRALPGRRRGDARPELGRPLHRRRLRAAATAPAYAPRTLRGAVQPPAVTAQRSTSARRPAELARVKHSGAADERGSRPPRLG